jgi:tetratricopeptide (TPR) repeat protein
MIVKNEEKLLPQCLESIKDVVDEIIIVDTGSKDKTIQIARAYGARVFEHKWENHFSKHRNQSIGYATGDWVFIIDADEELCSGDGPALKELALSCDDVDAILVTVDSADKGGGKSVHNSLRLFKNHLNIHYKGRVHNELAGFRTARHIPIRILHYGYGLDSDISKQKYDRTVKLLLMDIKDTPDHPRPHHYLGISFLTENKLEEAVKEAEKAIELSKYYGYLSDLYSGSYHVASTVYMTMGNLDRAEYWALEALEKYPRHLDSLFNLSKIYFQKKNYTLFWKYIHEYFALLEQIEKRPGEFGNMIFFKADSKWLGYLYKACAWMDQGHREKGGQELERAFACCTDKVRCHHLLAGYYKQKKEYMKSEAEFVSALKEAPCRSEIMWDFSQLYKEKNDLNGEKKWLEELVKLKPKDKNALFALGLVCLKKGDFKEAVPLFEQVLEIDEGYLEARINLALALRKLGDFKEAVRLCLEVEKDHPGYPEALSNLAYAYYGLQNWDKSIEYFSKITELYPDQLDAHVHLAQVFLLNQDIESCVVSCDSILKLLNLKRDIVLNSLTDLGDQFRVIAQELLLVNNPHLSRICLEIGKILTSK